MTLPEEFNPSKETVDHHNAVLESAEYQELLAAAQDLRTVLSFYICDTSAEAATVFDAVINGDGNTPWWWVGIRPRAVAMVSLRPEGYYWIKRNEPDGPSEWEVARFAHHHYKYVDRKPMPKPGTGIPLQDKIDQGPCWWVTGSRYPQYEPQNPKASNAYAIRQYLGVSPL